MLPTVVSATGLSNSFLGDLVQVCIVTHDHRATMAGMLRLGIGPWSIRRMDRRNLSETTYHGRPAEFSMTICTADTPIMQYEIIEPNDGPSIYSDFLAARGGGVQHLAFGCLGIDYEARRRAFLDRGYEPIQSGRFFDVGRFDYFSTEGDIGTVVEIAWLPEGAVVPPPDAWYPAAPPRLS